MGEGVLGTEKWWVISFFTQWKGWVDQLSANLWWSAYLMSGTGEIIMG